MKKVILRFSQLIQFYKVFNLKEKILFIFLFFIFLFSSFFLGKRFYFQHTKLIPKKGGHFVEGILGTPNSLNPIYAPLSDIDLAITELIFSGLLKYGKNGQLEPDLAESYQILEEGKVFEFVLKDNIFWQDGKKISADDVVFTIEIIQNPEIKSPLRASWTGVEVEKISEKVVRFKLKEASNIFLENCTLKIIPKHILEKISPENFAFSPFNFNPVGSGPYKLAGIFRNKEGKLTILDLIENPLYHGKAPFIPRISFYFFETTESLISAFNENKITAFFLDSPKELQNLSFNFNLYFYKLPRFFVIFFNTKGSEILKDSKIRKALAFSINKEELKKKVIFGQGEIVFDPLMSNFFDLFSPENTIPYDLEAAKALLEEAGFKEFREGKRVKIIKTEPKFIFKNDLKEGMEGKEIEELQKCLAKDPEIYPEGEITGYFGSKTKKAVISFQEKYKDEILKPEGLEKGNGKVGERTRKKLNEICFPPQEQEIFLSFTLVTGEDELLQKLAEALKKEWEKVGVEIKIEVKDLATLKREVMRKKEYDALLFGVLLRMTPDPFPFWHSSQRGELGLNFSNYTNREVDSILEEVRKISDSSLKKEKLKYFSEIILNETPAIFLFSPYSLYIVKRDVQGILPTYSLIPNFSQRFYQIENWFIQTKRVWK